MYRYTVREILQMILIYEKTVGETAIFMPRV
jgi:hypothetical protein